MIRPEIVRGLRDYFSAQYGLTYLDPRDPGTKFLRDGLRFGGRAAAEFVGRQTGLPADTIAGAVPDLARVSFTAGPLVVLSEAAVATLDEEVDTVSHEAQHGAYEKFDGLGTAIVDQLRAETRARNEADAYATGFFVRFLLTGKSFNDDDVVEHLRVGPYHLAVPELLLARGNARVHLRTIRDGICPPTYAARDALDWLRKNARDDIAVADFR